MPAPDRSDLLLEGFGGAGGVHRESAALARALAWEGVTLPRSRRPLSEAMCFGIAGGIAAGCAVRPGRHPAVSVIGRRRVTDGRAGFVEDALRRLGMRASVRETGGARAAEAHLERALAAGRPALVWCAPPPCLGLGWAGTFGHCVLLICGIDRARRVALAADRARRPLAIPLAELNRLRGAVRAHRRRVLTFTAPAPPGRAALRRAIVAGIRAAAGGILQTERGSRRSPDLAEWSRLVANPASRRGWPRRFGTWRLSLALRDVYDSVETAGTGGGLFRPLYAAFLKEAARAIGMPRLLRPARAYAALGDRWSELARAALPDRVPALRQARMLLGRRERIVAQGGAALAARMRGWRRDMAAVEERMRGAPLERAEAMALLTELSDRIEELHVAETRAARELLAAVQS